MNRVFSYISLLGFLMNDLGALATPLFYAFETRERVLDLFEELSGSRMMCNYFRFGGVAYDVSDDWLERAQIANPPCFFSRQVTTEVYCHSQF